jgi:hypothetical protein
MAMKLARSTERITRVSRVLYESQFTGRVRRRHHKKTEKLENIKPSPSRVDGGVLANEWGDLH